MQQCSGHENIYGMNHGFMVNDLRYVASIMNWKVGILEE